MSRQSHDSISNAEVVTPSPSLITLPHQKPTKAIRQNVPFCDTQRLKGKLLALLGALLNALNFTAIKYLYKDHFPVPTVLIIRYTPPFLITLLLGIGTKILYPRKPWNIFCRDLNAFKFLSFRALIHWFSTLCLLYSLLYLPIMIVIAAFYCWNIFSIFLSHCFLNERAHSWDILLSLCGFGGVILIADPRFIAFSNLGIEHIEGIFLVVMSALFYSLNMVMLRKKRNSFHWTQSESVAGLWSTFCLIPIYMISLHFLFDVPWKDMIILNVNSLSLTEWIIIIGLSISGFIVIGSITKALQLDTAINVGIVMYSEIGFAVLLQYFILNDSSNFECIALWIGLGAVIVSTSLIMYRRERWKMRRFDGNRAFRREFKNGEMWSPRRSSHSSLEKIGLMDPTEMKSRERYGAMEDPIVPYSETGAWNVQEKWSF